MKKLAYLSGALLVALSVAEAQNPTMSGERGTTAQAGGLLEFGRYTCPPGGSCFDPHGNWVVQPGDPTGYIEQSFSARRGIFGLVGSGGSPADNNTVIGWRLGPLAQAGGPLGKGALIDVGARDPQASSASVGQVGGPRQDRLFQVGGLALGKSKPAQGLLELSELIDVGSRDPQASSASASGSSSASGNVGQPGNPTLRPSGQEGPRRLGQFRNISLGPLPGAEPLVEEDPAVTGLAQKVVLYGRAGTEYALYVLPSGSASNGPSILVAQGMLFGEDQSEEPRTYVLRIPASFGVLLMPIE